jgi:hypothetical protein
MTASEVFDTTPSSPLRNRLRLRLAAPHTGSLPSGSSSPQSRITMVRTIGRPRFPARVYTASHFSSPPTSTFVASASARLDPPKAASLSSRTMTRRA